MKAICAGILLIICSVAVGKEVIAVGDLHGEWNYAMKVFSMLGVINDETAEHPKLILNANQTLIQTGDLLDRGSEGLRLLRLSMQWHESHPEQFVQLLGNHELMNLRKQYHFVQKNDLYESKMVFGNTESPERNYLINNVNTASVIDNVLYVHAGLHPEHAEHGIASINAQIKDALASDRISHPLLRESGPLWTRNLARGDCESLEETLKLVNATYMVVGHTPQTGGTVNIKCLDDSRYGLILIDTGISYGYLSGVKIIDGKILKVYRDGSTVREIDLENWKKDEAPKLINPNTKENMIRNIRIVKDEL
jgi:aryl carrier-like protein